MINKFLKHIFLALILLTAANTFTQSKKVWLYKADFFYEKNNFSTALHYYQQVVDDSIGLSTSVIPYEIVISNQNLNKKVYQEDSLKTVTLEDYVHHQIAMCYRKTYDYEKALSHFKSTAENGAYVDDYYYYANSLMGIGKYKEALETYEHFIGLDGTSDELLERSLQDMSGCVYALKLTGPDEKISVKFSDTAVFNKGTSSFAVTFWGGENNKVVFSSAREGGVLIDPEKQDSKYLLDLYWAEKTENGTWQKSKNFGRPLNSAQHEASGVFDKNNTIYFTRWSDVNRKEKFIYKAKEIGMKFFESQALDSAVNIPGYQSINPFISEDGKWLYYSSNRPGGQGGMDIWRVRLNNNGFPIGKPKNLGKPINSEFDETAPFYHEKSQTLFFSSDGHNTIGGLDIFKSNYSNDVSAFGIPENMGLPINSSSDDSYFIIDNDLRFGFLTSNRGVCTECDSTFNLCSSCYKIYDVVLPELDFKISGYIYDIATNEVIPGAKIAFKDVSYQWEHFEVVADEKGYYEHDLIPNLELFLRASQTDYFADQAIVFTKGATDSKSFRQDFYLEQIPAGEITIEGIEYDFNSAKLRPSSEKILDNLIEFLELNNQLKIEIRSHTDERGSDSYNLNLSERRAQSVVDYLIAHGIPMDRLVPKGYGETMPTEFPDENGKTVTLTPEFIRSIKDEDKREEYHQRNRRTAFFVLEQH